MEELREFCSIECEYAGTKETVYETAEDVLRENGFKSTGLDEYDVSCCDRDPLMLLDVFVEQFYTKMVEKILNVVETQ